MKAIFSIIISGFLAVSGYAQTRNVLVGTNNTVVQPTNFWSVDASNARTGLGLGTAATNPASAFQPSSSVLSNLASSNAVNLTNIRATNIVGIIPTTNIAQISLTNISGILAVSSGGTGATNAITARTNLGLGWPSLTETNAENFFKSILTNSDESVYPRIPATQLMAAGSSFSGIDPTNYPTTLALKYVSTPDDGTGGVPPDDDTWTVTSPSKFRSAIGIPLQALTNANNSNFRSAIGLPLSSLTNTSNVNFLASFFGSNTNPVLVNTSGTVVSPTNFWQVAPIQTIVQTFTPITNSTNTGANARNLYVYSLATNVFGVTNVIVLQTNGSTFVGDNATIIHRGTTSSVTAVRNEGSATNLIVISNYDDAIKFIHENGSWDFYHNISFVEPIKFTDGNLEFNKATSRTNLGIPLAALTNTNNAGFQRAVFQTNTTPASAANLSDVKAWLEISAVTNNVTNSFRIPLFQ